MIYLPRISAIACLVAAAPAFSATEIRHFDIKPQALSAAFQQFAEQSGLQIVYYGRLTEGYRVSGVKGDLTAYEVLQRLVAGTRLRFEALDQHTVAISSAESASSDESANARESISPAANDSEKWFPAFRMAQSDPVTAAPLEPESKLDEVVVQGAKRKFAPTDSSAATKIKMDIIDVPQSLSVLSSELMNIVGVNTLATAAALTPSVVNRESEAPLFDGVFARGFSVNPFNGNKINGLAYQRTSPFDFGIVERFEAVRGPASTVYGQSDYGATFNSQLKGPKEKHAFAAELGYDIHGGYRALGDVTGSMTDDGRVRGRLIGIYDDKETAQDLSGVRTVTVAPSFSYDFSEKTTLDVNYFHSGRDVVYEDGFGLTVDNKLPDISKDAFIGPDGNFIKGTVDFGILKITHDFNDRWSLSATGAVHHGAQNLRAAFADGLVPASGDVPLHDFRWLNDVRDKAGDLTLVGGFDAFGREHGLMLNALYRKNEVDNFQSCCDYLGDINVFDPDPYGYGVAYPEFPADPLGAPRSDEYTFTEHRVSKDLALSGMLLLHPVDRLSLILGLRWNQYRKTSVDYFDRDISQQTPDLYKNDAVTHNAGLVYEVLKDWNVYVNHSTGVLFQANRSASGKPLPAEAGEQWEVGAKAALLGRKLTVSAAAFQIDRNNVAARDPNFPAAARFSIAIDGQTHKGVEVEAIGEPVPGWNIITSYSYLDVTIKDAPNPAMIGQQLANAPHHMIKLYTTYQLLGGPLRGFSIGTGLFYVGAREVDNFGTLKLPAYTRMDLRLGYDAMENMSFSINAINLNNADIYNSAYSSASGGIDYQTRRTVLLRVNFNY